MVAVDWAFDTLVSQPNMVGLPDSVTFAEAGGEVHILGKTRRPRTATKTVRL